MSTPNKPASQLDFLPDDYVDGKMQKRTIVMCAVLFVIVMTAIGSAFTVSERLMRQAERDHTKAQTDYSDAADELEQMQLLQDKQRKMARQAELAASLLEKVPRSFILAEITNALPEHVGLTSFKLESKLATPSAAVAAAQLAANRQSTDAKKAADTSAQPLAYDVGMKITGVAYNDVQVAQFINRLGQSILFKDVNLVVSEESKLEDRTIRTFEIEMALNPDAEVHSGDMPTSMPSTQPAINP